MSNALYLRTWQEAIADLEDQLRIEGAIAEEGNQAVRKAYIIYFHHNQFINI